MSLVFSWVVARRGSLVVVASGTVCLRLGKGRESGLVHWGQTLREHLGKKFRAHALALLPALPPSVS